MSDNIEDLYPLTPLQAGMVYHDLGERGGGLYVNQLSCELRGALDAEAFADAWREALDRNAVLRGAVVWEGVDEPLFVVPREVELPLRREDWRSVSASELGPKLDRLLEDDRRRGFDLGEAPLLRLWLVRTADDAHRFAFTHHHLLLDGWSLPNLLQQVFALYAGRLERRTIAPAPPRPFRDYVEWLLARGLADAEAFFGRSLRGFGGPTPLGPAEGSGREGRGRAHAALSPEATRALGEFARKHRLTANTLVQGAWALLLGARAGRRDVTYGTTVSGRPPELPGVEEMVGLFINTLPVRARWSPGEGLVGWLAAQQDQALEARRHGHAPLHEVRRWAGAPPGEPLFESVVVFENYPVDAALRASLAGLEIADLRSVEADHFALSLTAVPGASLRFTLGHDLARFDEGAAERLLAQFVRLLGRMVERPDARVDDLCALDERERRRIIVDWNATRADFPRDARLHDLVAARSRRAPDAVAFEGGGDRWAYARLEARANAIARALRARGVGPGQRVGVCLGRSGELIAALLAVLKAGAAYVPLDPAYPPDRLAYLLEDSGARLLLTDAGAETALPPPHAGLERLRVDREIDAAAAAAPEDGGARPDDLAYVIYTSGSTGRPKGVEVTHRSLVNFVTWYTGTCELGPNDRVPLLSGLSFDASALELWPALAAGASVHVPSEDARARPGRLLAWFVERQISVAFAPTPLAEALLREIWPEGLALRALLTGGDVLRTRPAPGVRARVINLYGPTEATIVATSAEVEAQAEGTLPPIGRPIANARTYVLDDTLAPLPIGAPGELFVGGVGVARGYLGRPALTAERFRPDPFAPEPGARMYATGDRTRFLPDGRLEFLGRVDRQIKLRGYRIELGEIEAALCEIADVAEGAVVLRKGAAGEDRLVAYAVPRPGRELEPGALRETLGRRLPAYMLPSAVVRLTSLPLTPQGKVDRDALPSPDAEDADAGPEGGEPRGVTEEMLASIWGELLGREKVGRNANFFELGGHSLSSMQLASRVRDTFGIELSVRAAFEAPNLRQLAALVDQVRRGEHVLPPVVASPGRGPAPLSFAQERLWFLDRLRPGDPAYNVPLALRLRGSLDVEALRAALGALFERHDVLRTVFVDDGGRPSQRVEVGLSLELPVERFEGQSDEALRRLVEAEARRPFDLAKGPLLRAKLLRSADDDHVLVLTAHHVVCDAWSLGIFASELSSAYASFTRGETLRLPELPVRYADYAAWQRERLGDEALAGELDWWRAKLEGAPPALELPTDRPRPATQSLGGGLLRSTLPPEASRVLREFCRREGVTPFMALLAAFYALLWRQSGQDDLVVGTPAAGRPRPELEPLVGLFLNTLALRVRVDGAASFRELAGQVREATLGALAHQDLPFERLVEALSPRRDPSRSPIFQAMFVHEGAPPSLALPGVEASPLDFDPGSAKFDLTLFTREGEGRLECAWEYDRAIFDAETVERLSARYGRLLEAALADPDQPLASFRLSTESERQQLLAAGLGAPAPAPPAPTLHALFEARARLSPEAPALRLGGERLSYGELDRRAERLARRLRARGAGRDMPVGLCALRSFDLATGVLGILKAGGACLPLDPAYPPERLALAVRDAGARFLLVQRPLEPTLPTGGPERLFFDEAETLSPAPESSRNREAGPNSLAYVLYTSGSTGVPKGVAMPHGPLVNLVAWQIEASRTPAAVTLQFAALGFDVFFQELFATWADGGEVVLIDEALRRDPRALLHLLDEGGVERLFLPFVALEALAEAADREGLAPRRLREVVTAGEALRVTPALRRFFSRLPGATLHNQYGPTESHVVTAFTLEGDPQAWPELPPIGRPIAGAKALVLDEQLEPAPIGVPGELYLGGAPLARGYSRRPTWTAERFVPDPFGPAAGGRLYRSGDIARLLPSGDLAFLGRRDAQVKVRGHRIELGEVEAALAAHSAVATCTVDTREGPGGHTQLVAYVVGREGQPPPSADELVSFLRGRLPDFMLPSAVVALDALPLSPNGKVDRRSLPAPVAWGRSSRPPYVEPSTATEKRLAELWAELLGVERPGALDDFFDLGGHSLLATRLVSRVRDAFSIELPLRELFEATTLRALAARIDTTAASATPAPAPRRRAPGETPALSFGQQRLWFLDRLTPRNAAYNVPVALRLSGALDAGLLARSLAALAQRHEALRTTFEEQEGLPVACIRSGNFNPPLREVDLRARSDDGESALADFAADEAARPFDLRSGPLIRAALARLGERDRALLLTAHHAVTDGWSTAIMVRELALFYEAFGRNETPRLPDLPLQYADYAAWQRERLEGPWLRAELDHWKRALEGAPRLELPEGRQRQPGAPSRRAGRVAVSLPAALAERLRALASAEGCTPFMALLAAFQALLARYTGQHDLSIGTPVAGRTRLEFEGLVGFFVNTLVLRTRAEPSGSFRALLGRARETCLDAFAHQELPFERLVEELRPERDLSGTPLFRVFFSLLNAPRAEATLGGLTFAPIALPVAAAKFDLSLRLEEREGGVEGELEYRTDLFEPATAERLTRHLSALLAAAVAQPDAPLDRLQLSDESERATLRSWQPPALAPDPLAPTFPQAFAAQAARTPDARALVCGGVSLSYRELDARSNRLAHLLRRHGVGPETRVALFVERSAEMLVAMLGVLKSGGAYVPLDPTHPPGRHATIVAATRPLVTLTQARLLGSAPPNAGALIALDLEPDPSADLSESPPPGPPPESAAYVIFTSGSTGVPKGVVVEHRQLVSYARAVARRLGLPAGSSGATVSSVAADLGYTAIFPPLLDGGCVHIVPEALVADADGLAEHFARHPVDYLKIVPAHLQALLAARLPDRVLPRLALVFGGDTTPWSLVDRVRELAPSCRVMNHYGPTETTVGVVAGPIDDAPNERPSKPPLGRPLEGATIYLLDRSLEPVPIGAVGELFVGGAGVARGYLGRPAQTAERFLPDPFGPPGSRLYRTGDLARHLPDGRIVFLGRADHQIKVRGFRIELGEIEAALNALPGVRRAAAALRDGRLVAYVSIDGTTVAALDEQLRASLPPASVPSVIVELDDWPLLPSGKLDRARLPEPSAAPRARVEPRTPAEQALAALWQELLGVEQVGANDHFFDLGGHSLLATQLVARVRRALGVEVPLRALFEAPTLAALAARVDSAPPCADEPILRRDGASSAAAPLSPAQERLWFLQRLDPESPAYNVPFALRLEGALDRGALEAALDALAERHQILRSAFRIEAGEPIQRVDPSFTLRPRFVDLGALEPAAREASARALIEAEIGRPFSFEQGPPARALLAALGEREHLLVVTLHHALTDGWSRPILAREFALFYEAFARDGTPHLPVLPLQYADYAAWQRAWLAGPQPEEQLAYWKRTLTGAPRLELPTDRPRPPTPTRRAGSQSVVISEGLASALGRIGRNAEATPFMVLLAAYALLLSRHCGQRDLSIGTPTAGRTRVEFEGLVGLFVNTLVLRLDLADDPTFAELVARARDATLGAQEHQDLPFERVVAALDVGRDHALSPLFQTMFVLHNAPRLALELPGLTLESLPLAAPAAKFDLSLTLAEHDKGFEGAFEYDADLFEPDTVARLAERFLVLLQGAAEAPDRRASELPIMPEAERRKLLVEWNATAVELPERHRGIHELVEAQAARTPSAVAAVFEDDRLTYAELNARADRLAADLRERGVRDGAFVAVRMSRCLEVPVAMLGVLKAGAAFSPLDMRWPEGRTRQIVDQLGPGPIVTTPSAAPSTPAGCSTIVVDAKAPLRAAPASPRRVAPESPIYAIFTSGSTGVPKGVVVPHRGITNRFLWMNSAFGAETARAVLQTTHHVYDSAVWQLFWPLINGGTTVLCAPGREADAAYLTARIARHGVTMTDLVPSVFVAILPQILRDDGARDELGSLRALVVGGEEIGAGAAHAFLGRFPGVRLVNLYGPTEASIGCIAYTITGREPGRIPIGRPIANTQALVLDEARRPVPIGVRGELYLGGTCLGLGYLGDEAKTAAAFVDNPFAEIASTKLYRTGDLARWRPDGELEFLGRADRQVKIRGLRIELGEIEAALTAHAAVGACAVEAREGPGGDRELVAYLVPAPGEVNGGLEESAEAFARERLPGYLVPAHFVVLDALPSTAGGKLDRRALPAPAPRRPAPAGRAPRDERERALVQIWQEELGASPLGVDDDFFDLGGHSLRALRALPRIEAALGREVPLALLFERPTVASLLEALDAPAAGPAPCIQVLRAGGERAPLVLVHAVEGHAFVYRDLARALDPGRPVYALRARGLEPGEDPTADVETMAERYLEEVRRVCPRGPYVLGGWSMGGSVAFAMAHRLAREGEAPPPLALLDAFAPTGEPFGPENELALLAALGDELARRAGLAVEGPTAEEFRQIPETDRLAYLRERALGGRPLPPEFAALRPEALARVSVANARALASYRPAPYPGPTLLLQARGRREGRPPPEQGWAPLAPNLRVEDVEGDHHSIVRPPHVEALARALDRWLGRYEPAPPRPAG